MDTSAPSTAGARFTLNATVRNQGNGRSDSTTLRYHQSSDPTITTSDTEIDTDYVSRLDASESGDESISLDAPSTPGTYYYGACVDEVSDESDTTNNCSAAITVTVGAAPAPDLVVDPPTVDTSAPAAGVRITLSATVRNQGNGASAFTTLRYYQSTDSTITTSDTEVGTDSVSRLDASESGDESISLDAPSTPGTYYYAACVDEVSDESDTTNNCSPAVTVTVGPAPAPDLVVDPPTVDTSAPSAGTRFTLNAKVRNQGHGASAFTTLRYYQSTDSTITTSDTEVGTDSVSRLDASESGDESISLDAPSTPGTYYYGACVEAVSDESDTTNNCSPAVTVTVGAAPAPDLVVDPPTVDTSAPSAGMRFTLNATVRNQGHGASVFTTLRYYQSTDSTITTSDTEVGTDSVSSLDASESGDESISLDAPSTPGTYYYAACVDEVSDESDTTNNCSPAVTVTVGAAPAPDLVVDPPTVDTSAPTAGARITLNATVRNQGNGLVRYYGLDTEVGTLRYHQSSDPTITTSDTEIDTDYVSRLDASESGDESISLDAPSTPGTYYYAACVDEVSDESDTTNNCSPAVTVTVGAAPAPDLVVDPPTVDTSAPSAGMRFTLNATVRNQGNGRSDSTTLRYHQSSDPTITTSDTEIDTDYVSRLEASESGDESISLDAPFTPGTYYYGACVDEVSDESDTTNNCSAAITVTVGAAPAPDIVVDTPTVDTSAPAAGVRITLSVTVRNQGNGASAFTTLRYYQSTDSTITTSDTEVGTDSVSRLDASESGDESISLDAPSTPGTYYYAACVDEVSDESDTTNNCSPAVTVTVGAAPAPDLVVDPPTVDTSAPSAGARITLNAMVRNQGNGRSDSTTLRYYQSADSTITTGDTEVGTDPVSSLDASESGDESISLDAPSTPGTYYYGACVDAVSGESDATNNCSPAVTVTVGAAPAPDLVVDAPTVDTSAPAAGARFNLSATVRNQGDGRSNSTTLRYYWSTDSTIATTDTSLGTDSVSGLSASGSSPERINLTAPSDPGTYYYGACVDSVTSESEATNNCSAAVTVTVGAVPAPDLVVDTATVSDNAPAAGERFTLNATVRNQGNGSSSTTTLRYYRSTDATITASDTEVGTDTIFERRPTWSSAESINLTAPSDPGAYYYGACVDSVRLESDATNNCSPAVTVTVGAAPAPDLIVEASIPVGSQPKAGESFILNAVVDNEGTAMSASTTLRYYLSTDATITTADMEVGTASVIPLGPGGGWIPSMRPTAPSTPGTYYYGACVDSVSGETDATNNCSAALTVVIGAAPAPDLVVTRPTVSESSPAAGALFTLSATVRNRGEGSSSSTTLRYYRSADTTITTSDTEVGTDSVSALNSSGSGDESISLTAPTDLGTYYYGACVDSVSGESDTTNNCSLAVAVTAGAAPAPDFVVDTPTVSEGAPTSGASFTLNVTVRNQGNGSASSSTLRYYRSTDSTITTGDTAVGTDQVSTLSASGSGAGSISLTAPSTPGTYYYGACVDSVTDESDIANNCSAAVTVNVAGEADLVVDTLSVSESNPTAGESFTLNATVRNRGHGPSDSTRLRYYRSTDPTITAGDAEVGTDQVSGLNASGTSAKSIGLTALSTPGTYYYGACVDSVTGESDTSDNCSAAVTVVVVGADTYGVGDFLPGVPTTGQFIPATISGANLSSSGGNTTITFSNGGYIELQNGTRFTCESSGGCRIHNGEVTQGTMTRGESSSETSADLAVDLPTVSKSAPETGASFTLIAAVRNRGDGSSASTTLRYYRSTDATITTADTSVGTDSVSGLNASGSSPESITLTASSTAGTYYYGACVDSVTNESDTTNNCSVAVTVTVGAAPAPDLVVDTPTVSEGSPETGARFTLNATVRNQGSGSSSSTTLRYYWSTDATINTSDTAVGTDSVSGLNASGVSGESMSPTAPSTPGTYYYGACVDSVSDESDTTNNCSVAVTVTVVVVPLPDLVVDTPTVSDSAPAAGVRITLNATVRNQGNGSSAFTTLRYYQSTDSTITTGDMEVGTDSVSGLDASMSGDESVSLTAPSTPGTYYYGACVDAVSDEADTTNNCSPAIAVTVGAVPAPDLVVDTPTVDTSAPTPGAPVILSATVRNQGNALSNQTSLTYFQSTDSTITTGDVEVGTDSVFRLDASESSTESMTLSAPAPGTYYYGACVGTVSYESNKTNNCSPAVTVTVGPAPAPDLVVDAPTVDTSAPAAGASFTLSATVRNQGKGSSAFTTLRYFQSTDPTITTGDTDVGTDSVSGLDASMSGDESISLTAPSTPGIYYYGACVDELSGESDTNNNCSPAVAVTVGPAPAPDLVVDTPTVDTSAPAAGASFTLSATVRNQGKGSSAFTTLRYFQSTDPTITTGDTDVGTDSVSGLDASMSGDESISLTAPSTSGTYYYGACVDAVADESDTTNNCSPAITVTAGPAPDLVVDAPTVDTSALAAGASFTLSATVRNQGSGRSGFSNQLSYYQSADSTITTGDTELGTDVVSRLDPSESEDESISLTAPASPGTYYYGACVDWENAESDKSNNCSAAVEITLVPADLVVDTPTTTYSHPNAGTFFPVDVSVRNQGNLASEPTTLNFYRSTDSTITTSDEQIHSDSVGVLTLNETVSLHSSLRAPSKPGTYYYGACVVSVQDESNTTNNCSPAVKVVASQPDLVVDTPWTSHSDAVADSIIDIHAVVRNQGTGHLPQFADFQVYLSTDSTVTADDTSESAFIWRPADMLSSSEGITVSLHAPSTAGEYYYYACVGRVRGESDTTNNCSAAVKVTVRPADLVILLPTVAGNTTVGERFTLYATVLNQGDVRSDRTTIRYYRSTDATITSADTPVGTDWVGLLTGHETSHKSISLTAPRRDGTYYYGACVDTVADESSSTNNCSEAVEVTVGARPLSLRLTGCFVFQEQHFVMFEVRARIPLSSVVVHTYQVEGRNNRQHLMQTTNVGDLAAGSSYSKLTSRYFPAHLRRHLTTCTAHAEWDNGAVAPDFNRGSTTVPDLPPPPPTYTPPAYEPSRIPTEGQVWDLYIAVQATPYVNCGYAGAPPCPGRDHIGWWFAQPPKVQECAFRRCDFGE